MKPKTNQKGDTKKVSNYDQCQTPPYALAPLFPYLEKFFGGTIWEPASGEENLSYAMYNRLDYINVISTDLIKGKNFFDWEPRNWTAQVTNPPYSIKFKWMQRSYELDKPFALLLPVEAIAAAKAQKMMKQYEFEIMLLDARVDFHMPGAGWGGGGAQFPVLWFCWNLLPEKIMLGSIIDAKNKWKEENKEMILIDQERVAKEKEEKKKFKESSSVEA